MELHQLQYVLKLAAHLHFSNAANDLGITQPSLSQQIDKLEKELGSKLFDRRTRSVELTPAGEEFLVHANNVLVQLDRLSEAMQKFSSTKAKKNIRIGTFETNIGQHKTVNLFQQFQAAYPDVNASIAEKSGSTELIKLLKSGSIDAAFMVPSPELYTDSTFTCHPLIPGTVHVIFRKDHPLATQKTALLSDLATENCVVMSSTYSIYGVVMAACRTNGFNLKIVSRCNHIETMVDMVAQGFGISFLSSQFAKMISHPDIAIRPLDPAIERNLSFVYLTDKPRSAALIAFRDFVLKTFEL